MLGNAICSICTDTYDNEKSIAAMPCGHIFHDECLGQWFSSSKSCPSCRVPLRGKKQPIHKLFFDFDQSFTQTQVSSISSERTDQENRKLKAQISALESAISKLKRECSEASDEKMRLSVVISERDSEISRLLKKQEKMVLKLMSYAKKDEEIDKLQKKILLFQNMELMLHGLQSDILKECNENLRNKNDATYIVMLRRQLDTANASKEEMKKELDTCQSKLKVCERQLADSEKDVNNYYQELKYNEKRYLALKVKCNALIKSIESPRGVGQSLAQRIINQSPMPEFITPQPVLGGTQATAGAEESMQTSTPLLNKPVTTGSDTQSPDLFGDASSLILDAADAVKKILEFPDESSDQDMPPAKKPKYITSKSQLTQDKYAMGEESPATGSSSHIIKPKSNVKLRVKAKVNPIKPGEIRDVTNTHAVSTKASQYSESSRSLFFRRGYDGLGGQSHTFRRPSPPKDEGVKFSIFKKPTVSSNKSIGSSSSQNRAHHSTEPDVILLE